MEANMGIATESVDFGVKNSNPRNQKVCKFTPHHMAGNMGAKSCAEMHKRGSSCSANFYIGSDGVICAGVAENRRAWTSSSSWNDHRAITVEVANIKGKPNWEISEAAYKSLVALGVYVCSKYGFTPHYTGDRNGSITEHKMFKATTCPGPTLHNLMASGKLENDIIAAMKSDKPVQKPVIQKPKVEEQPKDDIDQIAREVIAGKWGNGAARKTAITNAGYDYKKVQARVNELLKK